MRPNLSPELGKRLALSFVVATLGGAAWRGANSAEAAPAASKACVPAPRPYGAYEQNIFNHTKEQWHGLVEVTQDATNTAEIWYSPPINGQTAIADEIDPANANRLDTGRRFFMEDPPIKKVGNDIFLEPYDPLACVNVAISIKKNRKNLRFFRFGDSPAKPEPVNVSSLHMLQMDPAEHPPKSEREFARELNIIYYRQGGVRPSKVVPHQ